VIGDTPLPLVGPGVAMRALAARAAELQRDVTRPVMLVGPRGLGKQFLAHRIHGASSLAAQPFVVLDARSATDDTIRGELSHAAANTTLLVRHVEQLTIESQRLLDERAGARNSVARVMATSTGDIVARVTAGLFLESLYYRLHAWPMLLPALSERPHDDLVALAQAVLAQTADTESDLPVALDAAATAMLAAHDWPDNLRELEATLALAQLRARGATAIGPSHLSLHRADDTVPPADASIAEIERWHMLRALAAHRGNRTHAARSLGVSRMTLITKLKLFHDEAVT
jgi:DNA-binding NtrC family response regulator